MNPTMRSHILATLALLIAQLAGQAAVAAVPADHVVRQSQQNFAEYLALLSLPNVSDQPAGMQRNAKSLEQSFQKRGFSTRPVENAAGRPAVFAQFDSTAARAKTVLFYIHFDGQPVIPENWTQKSPFMPVVKQRDAQGKWREVSQDRLLAQPLDPELRVFARSASDDKALLKSQRKGPAINVKVLLDSEGQQHHDRVRGTVENHQRVSGEQAWIALGSSRTGSAS
jgi:hypothetical protein